MPPRSPLSPRTRAAGAAFVLAVTGLGLTGTGTAQAADPTAQVWVTTADGSKKLSAEGSVPFTGTPSPSTYASTATAGARSSPVRAPRSPVPPPASSRALRRTSATR